MQPKSFALEITFTCAIVGCAFLFQMLRDRPAELTEPPTPPETEIPENPLEIYIPEDYHPDYSDLGTAPDWQDLEAFSGTITKERFEFLLDEVFTVGDRWKSLIQLEDTHAILQTGIPEGPATVRIDFAQNAEAQKAPNTYWKSTAELPATTPELPLKGLHIAIDAGHIGGDFAKLEERWFSINNGIPVREGNLTLDVAHTLKPKLQALGAKVTLVRNTPEPVIKRQVEDFEWYANSKLKHLQQLISVDSIRRECERLFYRTGEIRARANLINQSIQPDMVLCLHFNAESWGDPNNPELSPRNHLHLLLNGAYTSGEVAHHDERFMMLKKILQDTHAQELAISTYVAANLSAMTGLPPHLYRPDSSRAIQVDGNPYLWARNLLANRLYECPVIFLEPYVMNSVDTYMRVQAGHYEGLRQINGISRLSIIEEYARALSQGLADHYRQKRPLLSDTNQPIETGL